MKKHELIALAIAGLTIAALAVSAFIRKTQIANSYIEKIELIAVIDANTIKGKDLRVGYCYYLLEKYAEHNCSQIHISLAGTDSVKADIVAVCPDSAAAYPEHSVTKVIDSLFAFHSDNPRRVRQLEKWFGEFHGTAEHKSERKLFFTSYDPIAKAQKGRRLDALSPYDKLIRSYADSIGWDYHMLTAVVFQESRFHIEARSRRGAFGLMQMMPSTAVRMQADNLLNPEESIRVGALYLQQLSRLYARRTANMMERYKFTLAAYNAGAGRMKDVINYAESRGVQTDNWESLCSVMPEMRDSSLIAQSDTVKLGIFKGVETRAYVERVFDLFDAFRKICP